MMKQPFIKEYLPDLAQELEDLLRQEEEHELAEQVSDLHIVDRCRCAEYFCAMFYTAAVRRGEWGAKHRSVSLEPESGEITLDVVEEKITAVEVLFREGVREKLILLLP